ncbi:PREDICTED: eukaryotic translation initiation factor 2-alpha kinase 1 isoform X3 [Cyprinodon variegatus]|uniref:eukaryotic translation initiation factor 2-alpha kinase 1 isoform X3 n=1 Tax=Cyprinodon variegatus TaxID=28743 RepID=UPI00074259F3|nr:PREDICTED: eukaryotic translation initiation factor 2-alpha kinase 1 isoform X3 [Cyprinodon variegatus]
MYSSPDSGPMRSEECSGSCSNLLVHCNLTAVRRQQADSSISLLSLASEEDEDVQFDTSDSESNHELLMAGRQYLTIQEFASAIPNHLLIGSLLEHLCFVYESNPSRSRRLFKAIGNRLAAMNLVSPLAISDEFSTIRLQHNRAFTELLSAASSSLFRQGQQRLGTNTHNPAVRSKEGLFQAQTSRYLSEFDEICLLGKGSYGNVFKVVNKLDGQFYAVKKILIKRVSKEDCMKVLREVKMLSSLQHVNIVGYHTAWMEHVQPTAYPDSHLPALESPGEKDGSDESADNSGNSFSVVFQSQSQAESANGLPSESQSLVSRPDCKIMCPKEKNRMQDYVPCVFLEQEEPGNGSKCPVMSHDQSAVLGEEASRSSIEQNNNSCTEREHQQCAEIHSRKPSKDVQIHLMLYIQMQLCERSLKDWINERNFRPKEDQLSDSPYACVDAEHTLNLLRNILEGVAYIHSRGIMHRDLKPRNIFLHGHECHVRIGDFGLACRDMIVDDHKTSSPGGDFPHTSGVGTFVYAAPEQLEGSYYDSKSDMYSIGVLALELFQPFGTEMERVRTLGDLREGKIPDSFCHRWPVLTKYIRNLTNKDPSFRPAARQLLESELFFNKDMVIHGLQKRVEEQEEEIMQLRMQISRLQNSTLSASPN